LADITRFCVDVSNVVQSLMNGAKKYVAPGGAISVPRVILLKRTPTCVAPVLCGDQAVIRKRADSRQQTADVFIIVPQ